MSCSTSLVKPSDSVSTACALFAHYYFLDYHDLALLTSSALHYLIIFVFLVRILRSLLPPFSLVNRSHCCYCHLFCYILQQANIAIALQHQPRTHQQGLPPPQQLRQHSRQHQPLLYQPRSASTTYPQAIPSLNAGSFVATRPLNAGPASTQQLPGYHPASPAQGQAPIKQQPVDHSYPGPQPTLYSTHSSGGGNHPPGRCLYCFLAPTVHGRRCMTVC